MVDPSNPERGTPEADLGRYEELKSSALAARERAYSPYSKVRVGAALLASDGRVFTGCNIENASFSLTICAERTALFNAVSEGAQEFEAIAVATDRDEVWMPCGACRQALHEFAPKLRILALGRDGRSIETDLEQLLPGGIDPSALL